MLALVLGCGLLAERAAGVRLPGALIAPTGLAVVIVVAGFFTLFHTTAPLTAGACVVVAACGWVLGSDRGRLRHGLTSPAAFAAVAVFLTYAAPVLLSGHATFAGYIKLDDTSTWLALTDRAMGHGRDLSGLAPSTYEATLRSYIGTGYPLGAFLPWGVGHALVRQDLLWLFQPYESFVAALLAMAGYALVRPLLRSRWLAAAVAFVGTESALLYGYALWGGAKEMVAAALVALVCALLAWALVVPGALRRPLPLAAACAALLISLSAGGGAWIAAALVAAFAVLIAQTRDVRDWGPPALRFLVVGGVLAVPAFTTAHAFLSTAGALEAKSVAGTPEALGNLLRPLPIWQMAGIWPTGDFRQPASSGGLTAVLIAVALAAAVFALVAAVRARAWGPPLHVGTSVVGCAVIAHYGSPWVDGKALATASPAILLAAAAGVAVGIERARRPLRIAAVAAGVAVVAGVAWSNVLAYHDVNLGPRAALRDLEYIGDRFAGEGPALETDYQTYGARHFLRRLEAEGASELRRRLVPTRTQPGGLERGQYADVDEFTDEALAPYRTLVVRRSPTASRPPSAFARVWSGRWYEVWQRTTPAPPVIEHLPLGNSIDPSGTASCSEVERLAREAGPSGRLATVFRPPVVAATLPSTPANVQGPVTVAAPGRYGVWVGGSFRSRLAAAIDGKPVGTARDQLNYAGAYTEVGQVDLAPGEHSFKLDYAGPGLAPGSAGPAYPFGPLVLAPATDNETVSYLPASNARSLCGKRLDWIEAVR